MYHIIANSLNLKGKNANKLEIVKSVFERAGKQYAVHLTEYRGHARDLAAEISETESDLHLVAMGGDGTLHEVLNGIKDVTKCNLGIIPTGYSTDFAIAAGIPCDDVKYAAEIIVFKAPGAIDYIKLSNGVRVINTVGFGMDVDVLKRAYASKRSGKKKYYNAFLRTLLKHTPHPFKVDCNGQTYDMNGTLVCLGNGCRLAGGVKIFSQAYIDDGSMNLLLVDGLSRWKTLLTFINLNAGKLSNVKEITELNCKEVTFCSDSENYTIQADGELYDVEGKELSAKIVSGKLKFYLPKND